METFDFRGLPIAYTRAGEGRPLVFLHNGGTSHAIWREVTARLGDKYEVFALDLFGYGASAKPESGYTLENYVGMVGEFVGHHGLKPVTLVGNCMGSAMSLAFAKNRPQDVRALVLVNPLTEATLLAGWLGALHRLQRGAPGVAEKLYGLLGRFQAPSWSAAQALSFQLGSRGRARGVQHNPDLCACYSSEGQMRSLFGILSDLGNFGTLDRFTPGKDFPPICTIWGLENRVLSAKAGRELNKTLRPQREEWLSDCGHLPMLERPEEVTATIEEFLQDCGWRENHRPAGKRTEVAS